MVRRAGLHNILCGILSSFGVWLWDPFEFETDDTQEAIEQEAKRHVYFDPPTGFRIAYPCIIYSLADIDTQFADNLPYRHQRRYTVTVIDKNPDSSIVDKVLALPRCSFDRHFTADNLHHWAFSIYY